MFVYSVEWGVGYVFMWASKWILTDIFTEINTIKDAFGTVGMRTQSADNGSRTEGFLNVISLHIKPYINWCYILIALVFVIGMLLRICRKRNIKIKTNLKTSIVYFLIALFPFCWLLVIQNHSIYHWQFTCRILSATVFAGIIAMNSIITEIPLEKQNTEK